MPSITQWIDPEVFMEYNGVKVFYTYENDDIDQGAKEYFYTLDSSSDENHFDIRDLNVPSIEGLKKHPPFLCGPDFEVADIELRKKWASEWDEWHANGEKAAIKQIIADAIDAGIIVFEN